MKIRFTSLSAILIGFSLPAGAYEPVTHSEFSGAAADASILRSQSLLDDLGLTYPIDDIRQTFPKHDGAPATIIDLIKDGAELEDNLSFPRPLNHFFDPKFNRGLGVPGATMSPDWALEDRGDVIGPFGVEQKFSYKEARQYFYNALTGKAEANRNKDFGKTFQSLGMIIHHLQDMAQPQHVRNDDHCGEVICAVLLRHYPSLYEKFSQERTESRTADVRQYDALSAYYRDYAPVYSSTYPEAKRAVFNKPRRFWISESNDGKGIAEFTNKNFVSARTNFKMGASGILANTPYDSPEPEKTTASIPYTQAFQELNYPEVPYQIREACGDQCQIEFVQSKGTDYATGSSFTNKRAASYSIFDAELELRNLYVSQPYNDATGLPAYQTNRIFSLNRLN